MLNIKRFYTELKIIYIASKFFLMTFITINSLNASAAIIFDRSPDVTNSEILVENFQNTEGPDLTQWYAERFTLTQDFYISGFDIFSNSYGRNAIGEDVRIKIWSDVNNQPELLLLKHKTYITEQDTVGTLTSKNLTRKFASIENGFLLSADTQYWISMTGITNNIGLASFINADDASMWLGRYGDNPYYDCYFCGDMAFRIHGITLNSVSEPDIFLFFVLGVILLGFTRYRVNAIESN